MDMRFPRLTKKRVFGAGAVVSAVALVAILWAGMLVNDAAEGRLYSDVDAIPHRRAGLVLGCSRTLADGRANLYFRYRVQAAQKLFEAGKVDVLIVSGDNGSAHYDEATDMMRALEAAGVPSGKIYRDFAGFRSLDSVVRAKEIFGQDRITVISQRFHNQRAIYIARHREVDAIGFDAAEVTGTSGFRTNLREQFARVRTVLDVVFGVSPRFLGPKVEVV
jgi:SanA protein